MPTKGKSKTPDSKAWAALKSFTQGLYEEMDKLQKKAPSAGLSDLATKRVNRAIKDAKDLMEEHDSYVTELSEFVPAGDNPEVRDAVLVLREILQALERLDDKFHLADFDLRI
jgi:hypothetical protein